mgnify:CR=1 FL=1
MGIPRPESSYGKKGRPSPPKKHSDNLVIEVEKVEILDLSAKEIKKVFSTPKTIRIAKKNAQKPPRI